MFLFSYKDVHGGSVVDGVWVKRGPQRGGEGIKVRDGFGIGSTRATTETTDVVR